MSECPKCGFDDEALSDADVENSVVCYSCTIEGNEYGEKLMSEKPAFGTYAAHQPNYDSFKASRKLDDYIYQALVHMGNASHHMSWANTVLADQTDVPREIINEMKGINAQIHTFQERIRAIQAVGETQP